MTFWLLSTVVVAAALVFGFWRGRRYERASRDRRRGGMLPLSGTATTSEAVYFDWTFPSAPEQKP